MSIPDKSTFTQENVDALIDNLRKAKALDLTDEVLEHRVWMVAKEFGVDRRTVFR